MRLTKLFGLMVVSGGAGGFAGSVVGNAFGRGGLFVGGIIGGLAAVLAAGALAARLGWIHPNQRLWVSAGGVAGFALACVVILSTLSSPVGPVLSTLLVGTGAILGELLGRSPHGQS